MILRTHLCTWLAGWLTLAGIAFAGDPLERRYDHIKARNVFGLKELAPSPTSPPRAPAPPTAVTVTGITSFLVPKRAILQIQPQGQPPESKVLREGERFGVVEVVKIDVDNGSVTILNDGRPINLSMSKDAIAKPSGMAILEYHATASAGLRPPILHPGGIAVEPRSLKPVSTKAVSDYLPSLTGAESPPIPPLANALPISPEEHLRNRIQQALLNLKAHKER
jgi:hypothetical protein